jgi:uncharacterized protein YkwD
VIPRTAPAAAPLLAAAAMALSIPLGPLPRPAEIDPQAERAVSALANAARAHAGLRPLLPSPALASAARAQALAIARSGIFGHDAAEPLDSRIAGLGLPPGTRVGEILAAAGSPESAIQLFLASPPHRRILLSPDAAEAGWGAVSVPGLGLIIAGEVAGR